MACPLRQGDRSLLYTAWLDIPGLEDPVRKQEVDFLDTLMGSWPYQVIIHLEVELSRGIKLEKITEDGTFI